MGEHFVTVNPWMILPFGVLLTLIALGPLFFHAWWEKHYPKVAIALALVTLGYYLLSLRAYGEVLHTAREYLSFIALIGSLYIVSGGIHINVKGEGTPFQNGVFLLIGAIISNILGTTGASMLLIRPWIRMNKHRAAAHHIVFFIFIVANVGGCLTPVADPPLFLGYLMGVPFWWVAIHGILIWAFGVAALLAIFFVVDTLHFRRASHLSADDKSPPEPWRFDGLTNLFFLAVILAAVFVNYPPLLREALMLAAAAGSWFTTRKQIHEANRFNFHPVQEVVILFIGIFATMMPALDWLQTNSAMLKSTTPALFYWASGTLSSLLDNAPTYVCFLKAITGRYTAEFPSGEPVPEQIQVAHFLGDPSYASCVLAISIGAVFFGAATYIGNGPNFMVKAIASQQKVPAPSFAGYLFRFTLPFLLPVLLLVWWLFFRS